MNFEKGHRLGSLEEANGLFFGRWGRGCGEGTFSLRRKHHRGGRDTGRPRPGDRRGQHGLDTPRLCTRRADAGSQLVRSAPAGGGAATSQETGHQAPAALAPSLLRLTASPKSRERHGRASRALGRADPGCLGSGGAGAQTPRMLGPPGLPACALDRAGAGRSCAALGVWPWRLGGRRAPRYPPGLPLQSCGQSPASTLCSCIPSREAMKGGIQGPGVQLALGPLETSELRSGPQRALRLYPGRPGTHLQPLPSSSSC